MAETKLVRAVAVGFHGVVREVDDEFEVAADDTAAWWEDVVEAVEGRGPHLTAEEQKLAEEPLAGHPGPTVPDEAYFGGPLPHPTPEPRTIPHPLDSSQG